MSTRPVFRALHRTEARLFTFPAAVAKEGGRHLPRSHSSPNSLIFQSTLRLALAHSRSLSLTLHIE